jgi:hypothetical protein
MANSELQYKGFILTAHTYKLAQGYAPRVTLTKHNEDSTAEQLLEPPTTGDGIPNEQEALQVAIDFGKAAVDGRIPGIDISKMY